MESEHRVPVRGRNAKHREWMRFSAGFTDRRRALREMMRDRIPHEHATDERTAGADRRDQNRYNFAELNFQKYEGKSFSASQMVMIDYWIVSTTAATI